MNERKGGGGGSEHLLGFIIIILYLVLGIYFLFKTLLGLLKESNVLIELYMYIQHVVAGMEFRVPWDG